MASFLDKAKAQAQKLAATAKEKADDYKDKKKADDLLDDLGRILYRQRTERGEDGDDAEITRIVGELQGLEAEGAPVLGPKEKPAEPDAPDAAAATDIAPPPPPPPPAPPAP